MSPSPVRGSQAGIYLIPEKTVINRQTKQGDNNSPEQYRSLYLDAERWTYIIINNNRTSNVLNGISFRRPFMSDRMTGLGWWYLCVALMMVIYLYQTRSLMWAPSVCRSRSLMGGDLLVLCVSSREDSRPIEHERELWTPSNVVFVFQ